MLKSKLAVESLVPDLATATTGPVAFIMNPSLPIKRLHPPPLIKPSLESRKSKTKFLSAQEVHMTLILSIFARSPPALTNIKVAISSWEGVYVHVSSSQAPLTDVQSDIATSSPPTLILKVTNTLLWIVLTKALYSYVLPPYNCISNDAELAPEESNWPKHLEEPAPWVLTILWIKSPVPVCE